MPNTRIGRKLVSKSVAKKKAQNKSFFSKFSSRQLTTIAFVVTFAAVGGYMLLQGNAASQNAPPKPFVDKPERGLIWAGLKTPKAGSVCSRLFEVVNANAKISQCTHGPDPAPVGIDVRKSVDPIRTGENDRTANTAFSASAGSSVIPCDGDGTSGKRVQALYVHASDVNSRFNTFASSFQTWAAATNNKYVESGLQTGSARNLRWVHDANCKVVITDVTIPATGDDNFSNTMTELQKLGYNRTDRKYLLWVDANVYCGIGTIYGDDQPGSSNINNGGPSYSRADSGCWGYAEAHELMHNIGGVQLSAPHTSNGWHCTDEYDEQCYADASGVTMTYPCPSTEQTHFDCNKDDYFYAGTPPIGSYLATHWNTADSLYLIAGGGSTPTPVECSNGLDDDSDGKIDYPNDPGCTSANDTTEAPNPVNPVPGDTIAPTVTITSPTNGATVGRTVSIKAKASDNVGVTKLQIYVDGILKATSSTGSVSYNWNSRKASSGFHTITVKAYDSAGNVGQGSVTVIR